MSARRSGATRKAYRWSIDGVNVQETTYQAWMRHLRDARAAGARLGTPEEWRMQVRLFAEERKRTQRPDRYARAAQPRRWR